jgi:release factor glutamine methyltransferase
VADDELRLQIRPALLAAASRLTAAGVATPRTDSELLAAHVLDVPRGRLLLVDAFTESQRARYDELIAERAQRVPLQYLTGTAAFGDIDILVGPGAFIPRPETELLVAWGLARQLPSAPVAVDFCSGTGAIALAVAHARPDARVYAVELEPGAIEWLRRNASARVAAGDTSIEIVVGDVTDPAATAVLDDGVDLLLCNPPYLPDGSPLPADVIDHDPLPALFGGADGLVVIRPVVQRAAAVLRTGGWVGIEHDEAHGHRVADLFAAAGGFDDIEVHPDLTGRPRFTTARRGARSGAAG